MTTICDDDDGNCTLREAKLMAIITVVPPVILNTILLVLIAHGLEDNLELSEIGFWDVLKALRQSVMGGANIDRCLVAAGVARASRLVELQD